MLIWDSRLLFIWCIFFKYFFKLSNIHILYLFVLSRLARSLIGLAAQKQSSFLSYTAASCHCAVHPTTSSSMSSGAAASGCLTTASLPGVSPGDICLLLLNFTGGLFEHARTFRTGRIFLGVVVDLQLMVFFTLGGRTIALFGRR